MSQRRFVRGRDNPDILAMIKLTEAFGIDFWENAMIVLAFANEIKLPIRHGLSNAEVFTKILNQWKTVLHTSLCEDVGIPEDMTKLIKILPAGHYEEWGLPDRDYWLSHLWFEVLDTLPTLEAKGALLDLNAKRLTFESGVELGDKYGSIEQQPIIIPSSRAGDIMTVLSCAAGGATSGATIGTVTLAAGPLGAVIGIPAGTVIGFCVGLALGVYKIRDKEKKLT